MLTQTATCTPRDTQADSRTGAAGHTHMGTREEAGCCCPGELRGVGHTHGKPTHAHTHTQGHTEMLSHIGAKRSRCNPHKKSLSHACMNTRQLHTAAHYKRPCHSQAHTCTQASSPAVTVAVTQTQTRLHINTCIHNLATSIFLDSLLWIAEVLHTAKPLLPRKLNLFV